MSGVNRPHRPAREGECLAFWFLLIRRTAKYFELVVQEILARMEFVRPPCGADESRGQIFSAAHEEFQNQLRRCRRSAGNLCLVANVLAKPPCRYRDSWCKRAVHRSEVWPIREKSFHSQSSGSAEMLSRLFQRAQCLFETNEMGHVKNLNPAMCHRSEVLEDRE
jgi:hypothetical protein